MNSTLLKHLFTFTIITLFGLQGAFAQKGKKDKNKEEVESKGFYKDSTFSAVNFRSIGPAFMSGRIADIAIHPEDENIWYVAVGSGGVWKTINAGTTWEPLFDSQNVYSIGCISIDPNNPHTIWVGTGENIGGRHVGFGDGIYKSEDDGKSWENMGLKKSEHISEIIVHPENSNTIMVAVQGPLWNKGGERGFYISSDGGKKWIRTLGDDEWVGVTDIAIDPRDPDLIYSATWQRHRTVAAYMGGGPGSGIHQSKDGGQTWEKLNGGLPSSNMGKIGIAISPQKPDVIYAAIELDNRKGGVYRSENRGASWNKMSDAVSGATGPHYYQELYASPHQFDKLFLVDTRMQISEDGGKKFQYMNENNKHVDNHAVAFKNSDPNYLLVGTDGGLYESFDDQKTWRFISNLPVTQYYKLALDDSVPFYFIYGGTQDNNTHGGPSRTDNYHGIRNADWFITLWGDGHQPATEPGNPDIMYSEWQEGNLVRVDRTTGEFVYIQPQAEPGGEFERFNWDAPILVSPHKPERIYFASQRVWKSENRGDSWEAISADLTKNQVRLALPIMGSTQSIDNPWDVYAMSTYNTITSLAESPVQESLIYAGTDDGIIQVTENGGNTWRKITAGSISGIPATAFVNDIKADLFDANKVYVALDNHKYGDFKPYLVMSTDRGKTWQNMNGDLPNTLITWRIVQDHIKKDLFFLATEYGLYFTLDSGKRWVKFTGGIPTISFRDLAIQKRENDLVGASFGRGFYVLDDYSFLREVSKEKLEKEAAIFSTRDAWWYIKRPVLSFDDKGSQGDAFYTAPNPEFGATFTYHLKESLKSLEEKRKEAEKEKKKKKETLAFPGWEILEKENLEEKPKIWATIKNSEGEVIRKLPGSTGKGFHRLTWDLRYPAENSVRLGAELVNSAKDDPSGQMVGPGTYTVELSKEVDGLVTKIAGPNNFKVVPLRKGALPGASPQEVAAFWKEIADFDKIRSALYVELNKGMDRAKAMQVALTRAAVEPGDLELQIAQVIHSMKILDDKIYGSKAKREVLEHTDPTLQDRIGYARLGTSQSTYGPSPSHRESLEMAKTELTALVQECNDLLRLRIPSLERALQKVGAPWVEGQSLPVGDNN